MDETTLRAIASIKRDIRDAAERMFPSESDEELDRIAQQAYARAALLTCVVRERTAV